MTDINLVFEEQYLSLTIPEPTPSPADWNENGFVIKKNLLPENLMLDYERCWIENNGEIIDGNLNMIRPAVGQIALHTEGTLKLWKYSCTKVFHQQSKS